MKGTIDQVTGTEEKGEADEGIEREVEEAEDRKAGRGRGRRGLGDDDGGRSRNARGRGADTRGRGVPRRAGPALDPDDGRRGGHPRPARPDGRPPGARRSCGCTSPRARSSATRRARAGSRCSPTARGCWSPRRSRPTSSTSPSCASASPTPSSASTRPRRARPRRSRPSASGRVRGLHRDRRVALIERSRLNGPPSLHRAALAHGRATADREADRLRHLERRRGSGSAPASSRAGSRPATSRRARSACRDLPVTIAEVGPERTPPTVLLHGHVDVVPGRPEQFEPRLDGDRLYGARRLRHEGRAGLRCCSRSPTCATRTRCGCGSGSFPTRSPRRRPTAAATCSSTRASWATSRSPASPRTCTSGSPPRACWRCGSRSTAAPRTARRPWLGENAILRAIDVFRAIESLPFASRSSELFDRPSINLGRILGGDALNKVPDTCFIDVDVRYLPEQEPARDPRRGRRASRARGGLDLLAPAGPRRPGLAVRAGALRGGRAAHRRRGDERRPRRRLRRGLVPARRRPGGRVRAARRRPSRPRRVGLGRLAGRLPAARWRTSSAPCRRASPVARDGGP